MEPWQQQIRVTLRDPGAIEPTLLAVLARHDATLVSQLDAFEAFLADPVQAASPLGRWTVATLADPHKRAHHARAFAVHVGGEALYPSAIAAALQDDLAPLAGTGPGTGPVEQVSRHDTNPANNLPIPGEFRD